jgi:hypothetical protein
METMVDVWTNGEINDGEHYGEISVEQLLKWYQAIGYKEILITKGKDGKLFAEMN